MDKEIIMGCCEPVLGPIQNYYTKFVIDRKLEEITSAITSGCCITPEQVDEKIEEAISGISISGVTEEELNNAIESAKTEIEAEIPSLSGYATEQWVTDQHYITGVDLSDYATLEDIPQVPTSLSQLTNDMGFVDGEYVSGYTYDKETIDAKIPTVPYNISAFINDASYVTTSELLQYISNLQEQINSLTSTISGCCSESGETRYRWITMTGENDYWCSGTTKVSEEKEQSSTDGLTWVDTGNIRSGNTVLQTNCELCGYIPPSPSYKATLYLGNNIINIPCDGYDVLRSTDIHYGISNSGITSAIVRDCVSEIGMDAFGSCISLTAVTIPNNITKINASAFQKCASLPSVNIPSSVTYVGQTAFMDCTNLTSVTFNSVTPPEIMYRVFARCTSLQHIYVPQGSVNAYKAVTNLSDYQNIIEAIA